MSNIQRSEFYIVVRALRTDLADRIPMNSNNTLETAVDKSLTLLLLGFNNTDPDTWLTEGIYDGMNALPPGL